MVQICRTIVHCVPSYTGLPLLHLFLHTALVNLSSNGLAWYKATDEQIHAYKSLVMDSCHQLPWKEQLASSVHCVDCKSRTA